MQERSPAHPGVPRLLQSAAEETLRQTTAIEAILLYGSRAIGTHREDSDWDIAVVTELGSKEGFEAAGLLCDEELVEKFWTEVVCTTRGKIERYANTAGTLESRIAREAVLIAGGWRRPACTEGTELEIGADHALTWAHVATSNGMGAAAWLEIASSDDWPADNEAGAKVQRMAEQVTKGILATFGVYETDIHDLDGSADELENAYGKTDWMKEERAQFAAMVRGLKARGRAALRGQKQYSGTSPVEPLKDTIERLGSSFDLLMCWLGLMVKLHPEVKEDVAKLAKRMSWRLEDAAGGRTRSANSRTLVECVQRALNQTEELAGE